MKKQIFGFALFSFIFGATVIIYGMFAVKSVNEVKMSVDYSNYAQTKSCWRMKREAHETNVHSPIVRQAILDLKTKHLRWELDRARVDAPVALNFFVKDGKGTRFVHSELVPMSAYGDQFVNANSSYEWLENLDSYENLYVIAEPLSHMEQENKIFSPEFDAGKATPVLLY